MKDSVKRGFIIFMVVLFLVTSVGIGVASFFQNLNRDNSNQNNQNAAQNDCALGSVQNVEQLPVPEAFKPGADVTELKAEDLQPGTGEAVKPGDCVTAKYYGTLAASGEKFDGNFDSTNGLKFKLGQGQVISGWDQGLVGMKTGGTRRLIIPSELAYAQQATGSIPANSDLVFVVKLLSKE